uniref:MADS-box domain-containing protein n=1 Tax=Oryza barthii TaxID=65489 RepID=A0A0D3FV44_9ORYZ
MAAARGCLASRAYIRGRAAHLRASARLLKKAEELAVLCDAHVGFVVLSCSGDDANPHHFAAPATYAPILSLPLPLLPPNLLG